VEKVDSSALKSPAQQQQQQGAAGKGPQDDELLLRSAFAGAKQFEEQLQLRLQQAKTTEAALANKAAHTTTADSLPSQESLLDRKQQ